MHDTKNLLDVILEYFSEEVNQIRDLREFVEWESFMETSYSYKLKHDPDGQKEHFLWQNLRDSLEGFLLDLVADRLSDELSIDETWQLMEVLLKTKEG